MGLIREPLDVDFFVEPGMLTTEEKREISEYIREYKTRNKNSQLKNRRKPVKTKQVKKVIA